MPKNDKKKLKVQGTGDDKKVILWERSVEHENGEAMLVNDGNIYEVADTKRVRQAIADGRLTTEVDESRVPEKKVNEVEFQESGTIDGQPIFKKGERPELKKPGRPAKDDSKEG